MVVVAVGLVLEEGGPFATPRPGDRLPGRFEHCQRIHPVDHDAGHAVTRSPVGDVVDCLVALLPGELAKPVVLADEDDRQLIKSRHVRRFVEGTFVARAIPEEAAGDVIRAAVLVRKRRADRDGRPRANDAVRPQHPQVEVRDVHAPALALAVPGRPAEELGVHLLQIAAFGHQVAVAPVGAGDLVAVAQVHHHARGDGFLADVEVECPRDLPGLHELPRLFLEGADAHHPAVDIQEHLVRDASHRLSPLLPGWRQHSACRHPPARPVPGARQRSMTAIIGAERAGQEDAPYLPTGSPAGNKRPRVVLQPGERCPESYARGHPNRQSVGRRSRSPPPARRECSGSVALELPWTRPGDPR